MRKSLLTLLAVLFLAGFCPAQDWNIQVVDNEGFAGQGTGLWVDSLGYPHIIYRVGSTLKYTWWNGSGWDRNEIHSIFNSTLGCLDMTLDTLGNPHVALVASNYYTCYGFLSDTGWVFDNIAIYPDRYYVSIALDNGGIPHIAFGSDSLQHVYWDTAGSVWVHETALSSESATWKSIVVDSDDNIYIAYCTQSVPYSLKFAYYDSTGNWGSQYIDYDGSVGQYCNMILDEDDVPHIAYYDATNTRLKYTTWSPPSPANRRSGR